MPLRRNPDWVPTEHAIQSGYFDWAVLHPEAKRAYAVPNGGKRSLAVASKMKAEGARAGVLDVCLPKARGGCHGLYIEFKSAKGRLSPEQKDEIAALLADGYAVGVCRSTEGAIDLTQEYLAGRVEPGVVTTG